MRFSRGVSFNTKDTSVEKGADGRIGINRTTHGGVKTRCELVINALLRHGPKGATVKILTEHLNKRLKANYNEDDIRHACIRLNGEGIIGNREGTYHATQTALVKWRRAK